MGFRDRASSDFPERREGGRCDEISGIMGCAVVAGIDLLGSYLVSF